MEQRLVGERRVRRRRRTRGARQTSSITPFASSRSTARARPVPGRLLGRAGEASDREPPPLARIVAGVVAVALADLEDRDVVAGRGGGSSTRPRRGCPTSDRPEDRMVHRERVRDVIGRPPAGVPPATGGVSATPSANALDDARRRRARGSRPRSGRRRRASRGSRRGPRAATARNGGIGVSRQDRRDRLVAADAGDLLGDVGLDRDVAAPGRDDRDEERLVAGSSIVERLRRRPRPDDPVDSAAPPARSRCRRGRGARAARRPRAPCRAGGSPAPAGTATRVGPGSSGSCRRGRGATEPPAHSAIEPRRPVGAEPGEPELLALLEPEARLGAEGVALAGPADARPGRRSPTRR